MASGGDFAVAYGAWGVQLSVRKPAALVVVGQAIKNLLQQRIPPEPDRSILLHGVRVYGQGFP